MRRACTALTVLAAALPLGGAAGGDQTVALFLAGAGIAAVVLLSLPAALLLHGLRPGWIAAEARAVEHRKTACALVGAGLLVMALLTLAIVAPRSPFLGALLFAAVFAWFVAGFAGGARRQGERLTGSADGVRPLILGWLARAGAFAVPVLWPVVGTYLVVVALGAPLVAMTERRPDPPPST